MQRLYTVYCATLFALLAGAALGFVLVLPTLRKRRQAASLFACAFLRGAGIRLEVRGIERLPREPCVLVANHASYIDGVVAAAALPPDFAFVIKKEMKGVPLANLLLRRLGSAFVDRADRHKGAADARRVVKLAAAAQSLVFFPEGKIEAARRIAPFQGGAFAAAQRAQRPIVAAAIHGTRAVLPDASRVMRRKPIRFEILGVVEAEDPRRHSRELIARAVGEPLEP